MAATTDRDIVAQFSQSNHQLVKANKMLTEQLKRALKDNSILIRNWATNPPVTTKAAIIRPSTTLPGLRAWTQMDIVGATDIAIAEVTLVS
jgi:hypothetical protein